MSKLYKLAVFVLLLCFIGNPILATANSEVLTEGVRIGSNESNEVELLLEELEFLLRNKEVKDLESKAGTELGFGTANMSDEINSKVKGKLLRLGEIENYRDIESLKWIKVSRNELVNLLKEKYIQELDFDIEHNIISESDYQLKYENMDMGVASELIRLTKTVFTDEILKNAEWISVKKEALETVLRDAYIADFMKDPEFELALEKNPEDVTNNINRLVSNEIIRLGAGDKEEGIVESSEWINVSKDDLAIWLREFHLRHFKGDREFEMDLKNNPQATYANLDRLVENELLRLTGAVDLRANESSNL